MTDGELVRQALAGRTTACEELVRRWSARTLAFCHAKVRSPEAAEDLAQEALLRSLRAMPTLTEPEKYGPWLRGIALRVCLDWLTDRRRGEVRFGELSADDGFGERLAWDGDGPEETAGRHDELARLMREVEALPDDYREVVLMYYYQDVTYADLAGALGVSSATINARLTKARAMLRQRLGHLA